MIELAAVTGVVLFLALALVPALSDALAHASANRARSCGRSIYVAITGANTEREPLGLPPVWPADPGFYANAEPGDISSLCFSNSTDYFRSLCDEERMGTKEWSPYVSGLDYSMLVDKADLPACKGGKLSAAQNMWTIGKNFRDDLPDVVPVLITRNIDGASLAAKVTANDAGMALRFDPTSEWEVPLASRGYVMVLRGGSVVKLHKKYVSYRAAYQGQSFDATVDESGQPVRFPLAYLTPTRTVVPGEPPRTGGAIGRSRFWRVSDREAAALRAAGWTVFFVYLVLGMVFGVARRGKRHGIGLGLAHGAALVLWCGFVFGAFLSGVCFRWLLLALALLAQAAGLAWAALVRKSDPAAARRGVMWLVSVPLLAVVGGGALLFGAMVLAAVFHLR